MSTKLRGKPVPIAAAFGCFARWLCNSTGRQTPSKESRDLRFAFMVVASFSLLPTCHLAAQTYSTLYSFTGGSDGESPNELILAGGTLYGTTSGGSGNGTVFALNTNGTGFKVLHSFSGGSDGSHPYARLLVSGSTLYGTASSGGSGGWGTVFALNTNGTGFTVLHSFQRLYFSLSGNNTNTEGAGPMGGVTLSSNLLYGTAGWGGSGGNGTVFALNTNGTGFTVLHSFNGGSDGGGPATLMLSDNMLYGTAQGYQGSYNGTVFGLTTNGTGFTTLHHFTGTSDGTHPHSGVVLSGRTLYGTALPSGVPSQGQGTVFKVDIDGTGFAVLHSFTPMSGPLLTNTDGALPGGALVLASNTLYGTTSAAGPSSGGTIFSVNTDGTGFATVYSPTNDGVGPNSVILSGSTLFGTTAGGAGTVFSLSLTPVKPLITQPPLSRTNIAGTSASFSVVAIGPAPLSYQ